MEMKAEIKSPAGNENGNENALHVTEDENENNTEKGKAMTVLEMLRKERDKYIDKRRSLEKSYYAKKEISKKEYDRQDKVIDYLFITGVMDILNLNNEKEGGE